MKNQKEVYEEYQEEIKYKKSDLSVCPFCGGKADWLTKRFKSGINKELNAGLGNFNPLGSGISQYRTLWWVGCFNNNCWKPMVYGFKNEAIEKWNKRC